MNIKRTALFLLCLWLFLMALAARRYLVLIDGSVPSLPPLFRLLMDGFWFVQIIIITTGCVCARRDITSALTMVALCEALLWQAAITAHVSIVSSSHTRLWIDGVEVPSHMNPNPSKPDK